MNELGCIWAWALQRCLGRQSSQYHGHGCILGMYHSCSIGSWFQGEVSLSVRTRQHVAAGVGLVDFVAGGSLLG